MNTESILRIQSAGGIVVMLLLAWSISSHRKVLQRRVIVGGIILQMLLAVFVMRTNVGQRVFQWLGDLFTGMLGFVDKGSEVVFGGNYADFYFAFKVLPTIIFFSALMAVLYHLRVVQPVVQGLAWVMRKTLRTSGAETLSAAANVFVGQTEAPLVVKPYVNSMTRSELMAVMVGGFATIAGGVLAAYIGMGIDAPHLISASVISAPAALVIAKIMEPETGLPETLHNAAVEHQDESRPINVVDAAARGASDGLKLALNVGAMLLAFIALMYLFNFILAEVGEFCENGVNWVLGKNAVDFDWSLERLLGILFTPLAWAMGIESSDCSNAGELLGIKLVATEFVAYQRLGEWISSGSAVELSPRTHVILTYALCGFANFGSIGIQIAGIGGIAPRRRSDLSQLAIRAMIGGTLAAFMTACFAGMLL